MPPARGNGRLELTRGYLEHRISQRTV